MYQLLCEAFLARTFFVVASAAWHLLRGIDTAAVWKLFSMALWMTLIVAPIQAMVGVAHGQNTLEYQPSKIAAIEGHWENPHDLRADFPYLGIQFLTHSLHKKCLH